LNFTTFPYLSTCDNLSEQETKTEPAPFECPLNQGGHCLKSRLETQPRGTPVGHLFRERESAMYLTQQDAARIGELVNWLSQDCSEQEIRSMTGNVLLRVLKADYFASFVWDEPSQSFANSVAINMGMDNLEDYLTYFQYHDPITPALQKRRTPTLVTEVMPQDELMRTEFFNDFLAKDGLHYGINVYAYHGTENIGDLRIWRSKKRENFDETALLVLSIVQPAFTAALGGGGGGGGGG
jgi:hypothetical protein